MEIKNSKKQKNSQSIGRPQRSPLLRAFALLCFFFVFGLQAAENPAGESTPFPISSHERVTFDDLNRLYPMDAPMPDNVRSVVDFDPRSGLYIFRTFVGDTEIATPFVMTGDEYRDFTARQAMNRFWRERDAAAETSNEDRFSLTDMQFNIGAADRLFGPGGVQVRTQGSAELLFGVNHRRIDNPAISQRQRRNTTPDFNQNIQLNVNARVGTRINFNMNYNTQAAFGFDQRAIKLTYRGEEDDIVQLLEAGNVSMQTSNPLIVGGTSLFGVRSDLKFGRLRVSAIATQQQSQSQRVSSRGGAQTTQFDIRADEYDANRHFFLAHYFRDNFERNLANLPAVMSGVQITRVEVWVTNRRANFNEARNIVAFADLGEHREKNPLWNAEITVNPDNRSNNLYTTITGLSGIREVHNVNSALTELNATLGGNLAGGIDFEKLESARRLTDAEFTFNPALGIISLRSALLADDVLAVAFEYMYRNETFQVGEFSTDENVKAPSVLITKMLKSTVELTDIPMWDLMMKNVYRITPMQLTQEGFVLNIVHYNDSIGTDLQFLTEGARRNENLLRVMRLDQLDQRQRRNPDGIFDFLEGITVNSSMGTIMFPVLEPFGEHLINAIGDPVIAERIAFPELYSMTIIEALEFSYRNKFRIVGEFRGAGAANQIRLNAMNVPRGSVVVTAGGRTLIENVDYTVDYIMGVVTILDQALLESNTAIDVQLENQSLFAMQRKTLLGTHIEYQFTPNFMLGGTIMRLTETPLNVKINTGNEPIANTIWGLNTAWRGEWQWLTRAVDRLPFVNATRPSTFSVGAEFAHLIPGQSNAIEGFAHIDDFEATIQNISLNHNPAHFWNLASTPITQPYANLTDDIRYGFNRALIAWYSVDPTLNQNNRNTPRNLRENPDLQSQHITRNVLFSEIFPNRVIDAQTSAVLRVMNVSFFPNIRGPYNLNWDAIDNDGYLTNPGDRWGGIMRRIDPFATNFEERNIEYIEFWLLDPFLEGTSQALSNHQGGYLFFNLGDVSEDILKDGRKFFEDGLDPNGILENNDQTVWGMVPRIQSAVNAFDNNPEARRHQDVGLNGLSTEQERTFRYYREFLDNLRGRLAPDVFARFYADPAGDNFRFYRGAEWDAMGADILTRYMFFNGTEGNSADVEASGEAFPTSLTHLPDREDINDDNTLNEHERYFEYKIAIRPHAMQIGQNFITEIAEREVRLPNGTVETVRWYQFKIPVRAGTPRGQGTPSLRSIRFIRMYMTDFEEKMTLRFGTLDLVRGEWRQFTQNDALRPPGFVPATEGTLDISAVNIDENSTRTPVNYVMPPGVTRQTTPGQPQIIPQNEQAMVLRVHDLAPGDARAAFRRMSLDMRQYKRLQMFVHASAMEGVPLNDQELAVFIRLGTDMTANFYEYEIPLVLTPPGFYSNNSVADRFAVWPNENKFDFPLTALTNAKTQRNIERQNPNSGINNSTLFETFDPEKQRNRITVRGNPTLSDVRYIVIGVRNRNGTDIRSGEIWVNELRMAEFDNEGGWAAQGNAALALSDIGTVNIAGRRETSGFGSIESGAHDRRLDDLSQINISASADLGRFLPEWSRIQLPTFFSYSNEVISPKFNPLDRDILLQDALDALDSQAERDSLRAVSNTVATTRSFNVTNARINVRSQTPRFYDPANLTFTYAFTERNEHTPEIELNTVKQQRAAIDYNYSFNSRPVEPFKNVELFKRPAFQIIRDINFFYLPTSMSFSTDMNRQFSQIVLRDLNPGLTDQPMELMFGQDFMWNRRFDIRYNLTRSLSLSFNAATNAMIEEGYRVPELGLNRTEYEAWRDTVWQSIRSFGTPFSYQQNFVASWNLPINKIPIFSWVTANVSYNSNYVWNRIEIADVGHVASSTGAWQFQGQLNFEQLYNRSRYLRELDTRMRQQGNRPPFQSRTFTETVNLTAGQARTVNHRLSSNRLQITAVDADGRAVRISQNARTNAAVEITSAVDVQNVSLTIVSQDPNFRTPIQQVTDFTVRGLMMIRRASINYRETNNMTIPGFTQEPGFLGQRRDANGIFSPGIDFAFGFFDQDRTLERMRNNDWLIGRNDSIINPAIFAHSTDLDMNMTLEPKVGFRIELNARQRTQQNTSTLFTAEGNPSLFTGSYEITQIAFRTAFRGTGNVRNNYRSETFEQFRANRYVIMNRLNQKFEGTRYPNQGFLFGNYGGQDFDRTLGAYTINSPDVLIPAFLAAYTGADANRIGTSPLIQLSRILPNWRVTYDGLTRIPWIRERFRTVSLTHAYNCRYMIGAYTSFSTWVPMEPGSEFGFVRNNITGNPSPSTKYDIPAVTLVEQFSPLIGINVTMRNSMTVNVRYNKGRNLSLNLSSTQLVERTDDEIVVGFGYTINNFDVIIGHRSGTQSRISNDLRLNVDISYRDNKMLLRKLDDDITQATGGNSAFGVKFMANYVFSSKLEFQMFFDHMSTTPLISTSFPVSNTNFGVGVRFMLTR